MPSSSPLIWNPLVSLRARGKTTNRRNCWSSYGRLPASHWGHVRLMWKIPQMGTTIRLRSRLLRIFFHVRNLVIGAIVFWWFWCSLTGCERILWNCSPGKSWPGTPSEWFQWFGRPTVDHAPFSDLANMFFIIHGDSVHLLGYVDTSQLTCSRPVATHHTSLLMNFMGEMYLPDVFSMQPVCLGCRYHF